MITSKDGSREDEKVFLRVTGLKGSERESLRLGPANELKMPTDLLGALSQPKLK